MKRAGLTLLAGLSVLAAPQGAGATPRAAAAAPEAAATAPGAAAAAPAPAAAGIRLHALPGTSVGRVAGTRAFIAVSIEGGELRAYVCDGTARRPAGIAAWFKGRWDGRSPLTLTSGALELRIEAVSPDGRITGQLVIFGTAHAFTAEPASGPAGLYDGRGRKARATWIVLANRARRGAMACPRPPKRRYRVVTVTLADGTQVQQVVVYEISGC
jgi:hypothetical protein